MNFFILFSLLFINLNIVYGSVNDLVSLKDITTVTLNGNNKKVEKFVYNNIKSVELDDKKSYVTFNNGSRFGAFYDSKNVLFEENDGVISKVKYVEELKNTKCGFHEKVEGYNSSHFKENNENQESKQLEQAFIPFFPGCYTGDTATRRYSFDSIADLSYFELFGTVQRVVDDILITVVKSRLIYKTQLNVVLYVKNLTIITTDANMPFPLAISTKKGTCPSDILAVIRGLNTLMLLTKVTLKTASIMQFTNCYPSPGTVGVAYLGASCFKIFNVGVTSYVGSSTWLIFAHELGHNLGASHTFQNGVSKTGGIMDYGNPYVDGTVQFNPLSKNEMCAYIQSILTCPHLTLEQGTGCGDSVLTKDEECECIQTTAAQLTSCGNCVKCKLLKKVECSSSNYVIMKESTPNNTLVVSSMLSPKECCSSNGVMSDPLVKCKYKDNVEGVCVTGACINLCDPYGLETCPVSEDGCKQPCMFGNALSRKCRDDLKTSAGIYVSHFKDDTKCSINAEKGTCSSGVCITPSSKTSKPTSLTSKKPTTHKPTQSDSSDYDENGDGDDEYEYVHQDSLSPTKKPTSKYTTKVTTLSPTTKFPTTSSPTVKPTPVKITTPPTTSPTDGQKTCGPTSSQKRCASFETPERCNFRDKCTFSAKKWMCVNNCKFWEKYERVKHSI